MTPTDPARPEEAAARASDAPYRSLVEQQATRARGIAHEFNNVLGGIIGFAGMSLGHAEKGSILERNLLNILKAANRATGLVQQLQALSRALPPHGGDTKADSVPGEGSSSGMPLAATGESSSGAARAEALSSISGTERVLFVDDEPMLLDMAAHVLGPLGYRVTCMSNGQDAMTFLRERSSDIDILVTDQAMPGMTGVELAKEVLALRADVPVILCTGYSTDIDSETSAALGINRFVMKPYGAREIGRVIREALDSKRTE